MPTNLVVVKNEFESTADRFTIVTSKTENEKYLAKAVKIGIQYDRIGEIDTMREMFYAELTIEAQWRDDKSIKTYDEQVHWNPKLFIENKINEPKEIITYTVEYDDESAIITQTRLVKGSFWERLELQNFPIDIQALSVTITTSRFKNEIKLIKNKETLFFNDEIFNTFIDQQKWQLYRLLEYTDTSPNDEAFDKQGKNKQNHFIIVKAKPKEVKPKICAICYVSRRPEYYLWNAFFLVFLITVSSLNTFSIDPSLPQGRLQPSFILLLTSVSFKWVTNRSLPSVSYFTSLDQYQIINIFILCLLPVWHAIIGSLIEESKQADIDRWALLSFACTFILLHVYFIIWYIIAFLKVKDLRRKEKAFSLSINDSTSLA